MWFLEWMWDKRTRAVVVDADGKVISSAASEHEPFKTAHPGWASRTLKTGGAPPQEAIRRGAGIRS